MRHVSSWGIRMKLLRIAMRAPYHQGEGSLHLAHADGPPCDARHSSFHPRKNSVRPTFHLLQISHIRNYVRSDMSGSSDRIFHIRRLTPDGRGGRFNFPGQTCLDPLIGYFTSGYLTAGWKRRTLQLSRSDMSGSSKSAYPESFSLNI